MRCRGARPGRRSRRGPARPTVPSDNGERRFDHPRQIDGEDAAMPRDVAGLDLAVVDLRAPATEGEPEAKPGAIGITLLEGTEQLFNVAIT